MVFGFKTTKPLTCDLFLVEFNHCLVVKFKPFLRSAVSDERVIMSTLRGTSMDYNTFQSVFCLHVGQVSMFHIFLEVDFHGESKCGMYLYFISFLLVIYNSLQIKYYHFWELVQISSFTDFLDLLLTIFAGVTLNLFCLIEFF